jgi:hypothetical protein
LQMRFIVFAPQREALLQLQVLLLYDSHQRDP